MAPIRLKLLQTIFIILSIIIMINTGFSQNTTRAVVYLKNGSVVKGIIIEEISNKSLKIQTADSTIFVYDFSEVEKILRLGTTTSHTTTSGTVVTIDTSRHQDVYQNIPKGQFSLYGGVTIPSGDFASPSGEKAGYAKIGYGFGAQYNAFLPNSVLWSLALSLAFNPMNEYAVRRDLGVPSTASSEITSYSTTTLLFGFGLYSNPKPEVLFYGQLQIGIMFASTPDIKFSSGSSSLSLGSISSEAFAYGLQAGFTINRNIALSFRYISGQPNYKATSSGLGMSSSSEYEQPISLFQFFLGIGF